MMSMKLRPTTRTATANEMPVTERNDRIGCRSILRNTMRVACDSRVWRQGRSRNEKR